MSDACERIIGTMPANAMSQPRLAAPVEEGRASNNREAPLARADRVRVSRRTPEAA